MGDQHIYSEIDNKTDIKKVFQEIRNNIEKAHDRSELSELYRHAGYLVTLTHSPVWKKKFHGEINALRSEAEDEFQITARKINHRAKEIDVNADYKEQWGE